VDLRTAAPRDVALAMLAHRFKALPACDPVAGLATFQQDAVTRLARIIERRGGAFLCDSVGLGKTHVAAALARRFRDNAAGVLVIAPSQLAAQWRRHMRGMDGWRWLSHAALSRGSGGGLKLGGGLIIVDEAHAMRNPGTRRYSNLAMMCTDANVLLVTATPVNNSVLDFYHLIRLFAADHDFADIGVPDLRCAAEDASKGGNASGLRRVAEDVLVRRTRAVVLQVYGRRFPGAARLGLSFPRQRPIRHVHYELQAVYPDLDRMLREILPRLRFPAHVLRCSRREGIAELMRMSLLKRLESSSGAYAASIHRHRRLIGEFLRAAGTGLLIDPRDRSAGSRDAAGAEQLALDAVLHMPWPAGIDRDRAIALAHEEARLLDALGAGVSSADDDPKVRALVEVLTHTLAGERVVIFTEFRDTARMLWKALGPLGGAGLVHGSEARLASGPASRRAVIDRFAPISNHAPPPAPHAAVTRLVATDVLAEGLNLQDARVVISFDLPWNPVRLAQRIGRIDRLGSIHREIEVVAFMPDRGLDLALQLLRRIRRKLRDIRVVGGDRPRLDVRRRPARAAAAGRRAADRDFETLEMLRARYAGIVAAGHPPPDQTPVAAAMPWDTDTAAVLCCIVADGAAWLVLVKADQEPVVHPADADTILLAALGGGPSPEPDFRRIRRAGRTATAAVLKAAASGQPPQSSTPTVRAAAAIHRWLAGRPGGADTEEAARADALLRALAAGTAAGLDRLVGHAARPGQPDCEVVRELETILLHGRRPGQRAHSGQHRRTPLPQVCAALELVPAPAARRAAG
jgi:hypothetical protein